MNHKKDNCRVSRGAEPKWRGTIPTPGELYPKIELEYCYIANFVPEHRGTDLQCQHMFQEFVTQYTRNRDHEPERTKQYLKCMAPNHISLNRLIIYRYPPREEPVQKEERSASILRHKFQKHLLAPKFGTKVLGPRFAH